MNSQLQRPFLKVLLSVSLPTVSSFYPSLLTFRFKVIILRNFLLLSWINMVIKLFLKEKQQRFVRTAFESEREMSAIIYTLSIMLQVFSGNMNTLDGCATFFRRDRFSHVKKYEVIEMS